MTTNTSRQRGQLHHQNASTTRYIPYSIRVTEAFHRNEYCRRQNINYKVTFNLGSWKETVCSLIDVYLQIFLPHIDAFTRLLPGQNIQLRRKGHFINTTLYSQWTLSILIETDKNLIIRYIGRYIQYLTKWSTPLTFL